MTTSQSLTGKFGSANKAGEEGWIPPPRGRRHCQNDNISPLYNESRERLVEPAKANTERRAKLGAESNQPSYYLFYIRSE